MNNALFVAWRGGGPDTGHWGPVGRLDYLDGGYRFVYTRGAETLEGFLPFPGMTDLKTVYESDDLLPLFANRLLARSRPEYEAYLTWSGFDPSAPPDPIAILGVTEGLRATDSVELFPCPVADETGRFVSTFFLHGIRWLKADGLARINELEPGEVLTLRPEPANRRDPHAVAVWAVCPESGARIGYVPRYLARDVGRLLDEPAQEFALVAHRINRDAPLQQRVLCRLEGRWPDGFEPCTGDEYQPIVGGRSTKAA